MTSTSAHEPEEERLSNGGGDHREAKTIVPGYTPAIGYVIRRREAPRAGHNVHLGDLNDSPPLVNLHWDTGGVMEAGSVTEWDLRALKDMTDTISSPNKTKYDLYLVIQSLQKENGKLGLQHLTDERGWTVLHFCVLKSRGDLLEVFFVCGFWALLTGRKVTAGTKEDFRFVDCTPVALARVLKKTRIVKAIEHYDEVETCMGGRNAILKACRSGNPDNLRTLSENHSLNITAEDIEGSKATHWACASGSLEVVELIKKIGLNFKSVNFHGQTPLFIAVTYGHSNLIEFLVRKCGIDPNEAEKSGRTPIEKATENGDVASLEELKKLGATTKIDNSFLLTTAKFGRYDLMNTLIDKFQLDPYHMDNDGQTCLMIATERGFLPVVKYLLETFDFHLEQTDKQQRNIFHHVASSGDNKIAKLLLEKAKNQHILPAVLNRKDIHRFEQHCVCVNELEDKNKHSWKLIYVWRNLLHLYDQYVHSGHSPPTQFGIEVKSGWGKEPDQTLKRQLVDAYVRANTTKNGIRDSTPLLVAATRGHTDVAISFLEAGADPTKVDCFGSSCMHMAAMRGDKELAIKLQKRGLLTSATDASGRTPLNIAEMNHQKTMTTFFQGTAEPSSAPSINYAKVFAEEDLATAKENLSEEKLQEIQKNGGNVKTHIIKTVRKLHTDINRVLQLVGSGPVAEESAEP